MSALDELAEIRAKDFSRLMLNLHESMIESMLEGDSELQDELRLAFSQPFDCTAAWRSALAVFLTEEEAAEIVAQYRSEVQMKLRALHSEIQQQVYNQVAPHYREWVRSRMVGVDPEFEKFLDLSPSTPIQEPTKH